MKGVLGGRVGGAEGDGEAALERGDDEDAGVRREEREDRLGEGNLPKVVHLAKSPSPSLPPALGAQRRLP